MKKLKINPEEFKRFLKANGLSMRKLGLKSSPYYIGYCNKTIERAVKTGEMTQALFDAIMKRIDISKCVESDIVYVITLEHTRNYKGSNSKAQQYIESSTYIDSLYFKTYSDVWKYIESIYNRIINNGYSLEDGTTSCRCFVYPQEDSSDGLCGIVIYQYFPNDPGTLYPYTPDQSDQYYISKLHMYQ